MIPVNEPVIGEEGGICLTDDPVISCLSANGQLEKTFLSWRDIPLSGPS